MLNPNKRPLHFSIGPGRHVSGSSRIEQLLEPNCSRTLS